MELVDAWNELRPLDLQTEIADANAEKLLVRHGYPRRLHRRDLTCRLRTGPIVLHAPNATHAYCHYRNRSFYPSSLDLERRAGRRLQRVGQGRKRRALVG